MRDAMTTFASNALTTFTPTSSKVIVPCVKISSARIAASAPSRASPAGLACPCARPTIDSPGAHSSETSHVTWPDGDRVSVKPVKRSRSRRATAASARDALGAPSLDIAGISLRGLCIRGGRSGSALLVYDPDHKTQPWAESTHNALSVSLDHQSTFDERAPTVTSVTGDPR